MGTHTAALDVGACGGTARSRRVQEGLRWLPLGVSMIPSTHASRAPARGRAHAIPRGDRAWRVAGVVGRGKTKRRSRCNEAAASPRTTASDPLRSRSQT